MVIYAVKTDNYLSRGESVIDYRKWHHSIFSEVGVEPREVKFLFKLCISYLQENEGDFSFSKRPITSVRDSISGSKIEISAKHFSSAK